MKNNLDQSPKDPMESFYAILLFVTLIIAVFYIVALACGYVFKDLFNEPTQQL